MEERGWPIRTNAARALSAIAISAAERAYLLGRLPGEERVAPRDLLAVLDPERVRRWLGVDRPRYEVGAFAAWLLADAEDTAAVPLCQAVLRDRRSDPYLRLLAAYALVRAGRAEYVCDLVDFLGDRRHEFQDAVPSLLLDVVPSHPAELALCLRRGLADPRPRAREVSAWTAGAGRVTGASPAIREALDDPVARVRAAAAWAAGRLGDAGARPALARLAEASGADGDPTTHAFAVDALARLDDGAR
jgi:HEAT repeat protein